MHTPDEIAADISWIRERVEGRPFGIDLVLPASSPLAETLDDMLAKIPETHREFARKISRSSTFRTPRGPLRCTSGGA
jgi:hypothetical protein